MFVIGEPSQLRVMEQSNLFGQFVSYKENKVLWIRPLEPYSHHFIFFLNYEWENKLEFYITHG